MKWPGKVNPADLMTKYLSRDEILAHLLRMNLTSMAGRAASTPVRTDVPAIEKAAPLDNDGQTGPECTDENELSFCAQASMADCNLDDVANVNAEREMQAAMNTAKWWCTLSLDKLISPPKLAANPAYAWADMDDGFG